MSQIILLVKLSYFLAGKKKNDVSFVCDILGYPDINHGIQPSNMLLVEEEIVFLPHLPRWRCANKLLGVLFTLSSKYWITWYYNLIHIAHPSIYGNPKLIIDERTQYCHKRRFECCAVHKLFMSYVWHQH